MARRPNQPAAFSPQLDLVRRVEKKKPEAEGAETVSREPRRYAAEPGAFFADPDSLAELLRESGAGEAVKLREIVRAQDYSAFGGSKEVGRRPIAPWIFVGLVAYGLMRGLSSLRELERLARLDLGAIYICGGLRPDHSTIGLFLHTNAAVLSERFFVDVVRELSTRLGAVKGTTAIDGTIVAAVASAHRHMTAEAARLAADVARQEAAERPGDARAEQSAELAAEVAVVAEFRQAERDDRGAKGPARVSPTEPDAVLQPLKEGPVRASYKPSIQVHESGLIVGQHCDASSEQAAIAPLLDQHERIFDAPPERTLLDAGYHDPGTLQQFVDRNVDVLCPAGKESTPLAKRSAKISKADFVFDDLANAYSCPGGRSLVVWDRFTDTDGRPITRYRSPDCSACSLRPQCCRGKANRTIKRYEGDALKEAAAAILRQPEARRLYAQRKAIVEPVFARLKERQGLRRFLRRGRCGAALEFALHCLAYNLGLAARRLDRALRFLRFLLVAFDACHHATRSGAGSVGSRLVWPSFVARFSPAQ